MQSISSQGTGETTLMLACKDNKLVIVERLIEAGVNVNAKSKVGEISFPLVPLPLIIQNIFKLTIQGL